MAYEGARRGNGRSAVRVARKPPKTRRDPVDIVNRRRRKLDDRSRQVEEFVEEWADAEERGDGTFLEGALTDDFVGVGPLGFMLTKGQWLGRFSGGLSYASFAIDEAQTRLYGKAAVATGRQVQAGSFQGNDVGGEFRTTLVLVERDGRWLLAGWHASPIAGAPSFLNR
jgi:ketosteroid isomerase-like protein